MKPPMPTRAAAALPAGGLRVKALGLTRVEGGRLRKYVDLCLCVPSGESPRIQEARTLVIHAIAEMVESEIVLGPEH